MPIILPPTFTVGVDDVSTLELEKEALVLREEHLPVDIIHLVSLDEPHDVQVVRKLALTSLEQLVVLFRHRVPSGASATTAAEY